MNYERKFASEWPFRDLRRGLFVANAIPSLLDVRQRADRERPQDVACSQPILAVQTVELVKVTPLSVPRPRFGPQRFNALRKRILILSLAAP